MRKWETLIIRFSTGPLCHNRRHQRAMCVEGAMYDETTWDYQERLLFDHEGIALLLCSNYLLQTSYCFSLDVAKPYTYPRSQLLQEQHLHTNVLFKLTALGMNII